MSQLSHRESDLFGRNETVAIPVKEAEDVEDLLILLEVAHFGAHQLQEFGKVDLSATVVVQLLQWTK